MLLRKKPPSPSPPRLTSSIPEMKRYLMAMDSPAPEAPVEKVGASAIIPEKILATSDHHQDHCQTQAPSPDDKAAPDLAGSHVAIAKGNAIASTASTINHARPTKSKMIRVKAQRSRPRLLTLVVCISYLLFQFLGLDLGLRLINGYTEPRLTRAEVRLEGALNDVVHEQILHTKLDTLLGSRLERQYMESYEHCLARGLYKADKVFLGLDFTWFSDVRDQTIDWVTNNCDRLFYTPQLHTANNYRLWTTVENIRRVAERALRLLKRKAALLRYKLHGIDPLLAASPVFFKAINDTTKRSLMPPKMPFGFSLDCEAGVCCRLTHSGPYISATGMEMMREAAVEASKEVFKWSYSFEKPFRVTGCIISLLSLLQPLLGICFVLAVLLSRPRPWPQFQLAPKTPKVAYAGSHLSKVITHLQHDEKLAVGLVVNTALYALFHHEFDFITSDLDRLLLPVGLGFCAFHIPQALAFLNPVPEGTETLRSLYRAMHELYFIFHGTECLPGLSFSTQPPSTRRKTKASLEVRPASKIGARFISPLTPISEDLQQERRAMHVKQGKAPSNDVEPRYGYATETDSEYESDVRHASYVDLTGGGTPTLSENGEDWSVVEG